MCNGKVGHFKNNFTFCVTVATKIIFILKVLFKTLLYIGNETGTCNEF